VQDRISGFEDKIDIKEKKKPRRTTRQNTQELWKEYVRTQWLHQKTKPQNHGHEEGEEVQAKGIC
jgi:hypothetical protein